MTPRFLYGTAWKEDATRALVHQALNAGFRGIDTANQRKHYFEAAVGQGIADSGLSRDELWLQTKFTFRPGQDHRLPYDPAAPIATQVAQSFASSLEHLGTDRIDSYVLHGPSRRYGLGEADWQAWQAMEALHDDGVVGALGVSNVSADQLRLLCEGARVKPAFVQNRCYARFGWDADVREVCREHGAVYQGFSLLTANMQVLVDAAMREIAQRHGRTPAQIVFAFAAAAGMLPLTGTTSAEHMRQDLDALELVLSRDEVRTIEGLG